MVKKKDDNLLQIKLRNFFKNNQILIIFFVIILVLGLFSVLMSKNEETVLNKVYGDDVVDLYYFHLKTCPHCIEQNKYMNDFLFVKYPNLRLNSYEMTQRESVLKYQEMANFYNGLEPDNFPGTPLSIIGDNYNIGFGTALTTGPKLIEMIEAEMVKINSNWNSSMKRTIDLNN